MTEHMMIGIAIATAAVSVLTLAGTLLARRFRKGHGISIIIPFRCSDPDDQRVRNLEWLKRYWAAQLPGAEIVMGEDPEWDRPFSKSVAVNNGVAKSSGDVLVIVDADGFIKVEHVLHCAREIREGKAPGELLWFVPSRQFYRLTEEASKWLLRSDPKKPYEFNEPLP